MAYSARMALPQIYHCMKRYICRASSARYRTIIRDTRAPFPTARYAQPRGGCLLVWLRHWRARTCSWRWRVRDARHTASYSERFARRQRVADITAIYARNAGLPCRCCCLAMLPTGALCLKARCCCQHITTRDA